MDVSSATASTSCVAICFGMNTKSNASSKPFRIAGRLAIISLAALWWQTRENEDDKIWLCIPSWKKNTDIITYTDGDLLIDERAQ